MKRIKINGIKGIAYTSLVGFICYDLQSGKGRFVF